MLKAKTYNIAETNIANLGSDLEKKVKAAAAKLEPAWTNAGKKEGLEIWRIEKFHVVPWPKAEYGSFYTGDSYIILNTYKKKNEKGAEVIAWIIHFWLGTTTSQDEAGTAAYKVVELDDMLSGAAPQYREVEGHESSQFLSYFKASGGIKLLEGGIESGFHHVAAAAYQPRLLWVKGRKNARVHHVALSNKSLNQGACFVLDAGTQVYQLMGSKVHVMEKMRAAQIAKSVSDDHKGAAVAVFNEGDTGMDPVWKLIPDGELKTWPAPEAHHTAGDEAWELQSHKKLFRYSDRAPPAAAAGATATFTDPKDSKKQHHFTKVAEGKDVTKAKLDTKDAFIVDVGAEVFVWVGKAATVGERKKALGVAQHYLTHHKLPVYIPIVRIEEGHENAAFIACLG